MLVESYVKIATLSKQENWPGRVTDLRASRGWIISMSSYVGELSLRVRWRTIKNLPESNNCNRSLCADERADGWTLELNFGVSRKLAPRSGQGHSATRSGLSSVFARVCTCARACTSRRTHATSAGYASASMYHVVCIASFRLYVCTIYVVAYTNAARAICSWGFLY